MAATAKAPAAGYADSKRPGAPAIATEVADDFEDIIDSPFGAEHAQMLTGDDSGEEEFIIKGDSGSTADTVFDRQVEVLQEVVMDDSFQDLLQDFCKKNCHHFEDTEENKLIYTDLFKKYSELVEGHLEKKLVKAIPGFVMDTFLEELAKRGEEEIDDAVFDLLASLGDFPSFKQQMLDTKDAERCSLLSVGGKASKIHVDEDEEGEERPDLADLLVVTPASPSPELCGSPF
ncbi:unnamed protein product, partial [Polarella glacialis]